MSHTLTLRIYSDSSSCQMCKKLQRPVSCQQRNYSDILLLVKYKEKNRA